ncbi:hypothetical protein HDU67_001439, partial [Dinochytrium kinnereticum]
YSDPDLITVEPPIRSTRFNLDNLESFETLLYTRREAKAPKSKRDAGGFPVCCGREDELRTGRSTLTFIKKLRKCVAQSHVPDIASPSSTVKVMEKIKACFSKRRSHEFREISSEETIGSEDDRVSRDFMAEQLKQSGAPSKSTEKLLLDVVEEIA